MPLGADRSNATVEAMRGSTGVVGGAVTTPVYPALGGESP